MKVSLYPAGQAFSKCLVLVGGSGDTVEGFMPLTTKIIQKLPDYSICTFNFSTTSKSESLLDVQARELGKVFKQLTTDYHFDRLDIFTTSMGAYATIKLLSINKYNDQIKNVIFYDPADYYLSARFAVSDDVTWSGPQAYSPTDRLISDEIKEIKGDYLISIVHLTLRNYTQNGYIDHDFINRGKDHDGGYPRLSAQMVQAIFDKIPVKNRGKYIKEPNVPHAILRDGNIQANLERVSDTILDILTKSTMI